VLPLAQEYEPNFQVSHWLLTPDRRTVAMRVEESDFRYSLYAATLEGGAAPRRLTDSDLTLTGETLLRSSPDGDWVLYERGYPGELMRVALDGSAPAQALTSLPATHFDLEISPNGPWGQWVVFRTEVEDRLFSVSASGGTPIALHDAVVSRFAVSHDGLFVLFVGGAGGHTGLFRVPIDRRSEPVELSSPTHSVSGLELSPDGLGVAYRLRESVRGGCSAFASSAAHPFR
jgi:hypothetical protein